jgi:hypothetical protein
MKNKPMFRLVPPCSALFRGVPLLFQMVTILLLMVSCNALGDINLVLGSKSSSTNCLNFYTQLNAYQYNFSSYKLLETNLSSGILTKYYYGNSGILFANQDVYCAYTILESINNSYQCELWTLVNGESYGHAGNCEQANPQTDYWECDGTKCFQFQKIYYDGIPNPFPCLPPLQAGDNISCLVSCLDGYGNEIVNNVVSNISTDLEAANCSGESSGIYENSTTTTFAGTTTTFPAPTTTGAATTTTGGVTTTTGGATTTIPVTSTTSGTPSTVSGTTLYGYSLPHGNFGTLPSLNGTGGNTINNGTLKNMPCTGFCIIGLNKDQFQLYAAIMVVILVLITIKPFKLGALSSAVALLFFNNIMGWTTITGSLMVIFVFIAVAAWWLEGKQ